ncbi:ABC transporter substrate-binding protein [Kineococcus gynurae]|uniref:ABC transporter substrate-binding protein n=1 Tax=Kineococcus gynurae TaxID=452979 RepID=A0ABV5LX66_9ACTN
MITPGPSRRRLLLALGGGCATLIAGCGDDAASEGTAAVPSASATPSTAAPGAQTWVTPRELPEGWGSTEADGVFPRTVVHLLGETTLDRAPTRIAGISTGQLDALLTLGLVPAGATTGEGAGLVPDYLASEFADRTSDLAALADLGLRTEPNLEAVAALAPDLVLVNASGPDDRELFDALSAIAPTVATRSTGLYWKQNLLLMGDAVGLGQKARALLADHQEAAAAFGAGLTTVPSVSLLRRNGDRVRIFGVSSFAGSVLEDARLPRPESQRFTDSVSTDLSPEQLGDADGDWIFFGVQGGDAAELTALPLWSGLAAVQSDRAVEVDDDPFYLNTGPTAARLVLEQLQTSLTTR